MIRCPSLVTGTLVACFAMASMALAQPAPRAVEDAGRDAHLLRLGEHFFDSGQYFRAIGAFEELGLFTSDPLLARHARFRIAMSYHRGHQIEDAVKHYDKLLLGGAELTGEPANWVRLLRVIARSEGTWRRLGPVPPEDLIADLAPLERHESAPYQVLAGYHLARLHLVLSDRISATAILARAHARCSTHPSEACAGLPKLKGATNLAEVKSKSPAVGLLLSAAVPGLGAVYTGHPVDGLYYFALTAGSGFFAWSSYDDGRRIKDQPTAFFLLSTLAATFYLSSVAQGWLGAKRANAVAEFERREAILRTTEWPLPDPFPPP